MTIEILSNEHLNQMKNQHQIMVLDIYGDYCQPCKQMKPAYDNLSLRYSSPQVAFCSLNVELGLVQGVRGVPTLQVFTNGQLAQEILGADLQQLEQMLSNLNVREQSQPYNPPQQVQRQQLQTSSQFIAPAVSTPQFKNKTENSKSSGYKTWNKY
jgi:thioredoxin 1